MKKMVALLLYLFISTNLIAGYAYAAVNNQQNLPNSLVVKGWANEAFMAAYSYDFANYNEELAQASKYFTPEAWKNFKSMLDKSGNLQLIKDKTLISVGLAEGIGPLILAEGNVNNVYTWKVRFPAVITYQGPTSIQKVQHLIVNMTIIRTDGKEGIRGMAIQKMDVNLVSQTVAPSSEKPGSPLTPDYMKALDTLQKTKSQGSGGKAPF